MIEQMTTTQTGTYIMIEKSEWVLLLSAIAVNNRHIADQMAKVPHTEVVMEREVRLLPQLERQMHES